MQARGYLTRGVEAGRIGHRVGCVAGQIRKHGAFPVGSCATAILPQPLSQDPPYLRAIPGRPQ
jgi:hypothetical protein